MFKPFILDTRERAPYAPGRFLLRFKWAEFDRCTAFYSARHFGRTWEVTDEFRHSLAGTFRSEWEAGRLDPDSAFIRFFYSDVPQADSDWRHICRVVELAQRAERRAIA